MLLLYQYTDLESALKIIQEGHIDLRAKRYDHLSDSTDCQYARKYVLPTITRLLKQDVCKTPKDYPYPACFTILKDSAYMWNHHSTSHPGEGVRLGFYASVIKRNRAVVKDGTARFNFELIKCGYAKNEQEVIRAYRSVVPKIYDLEHPVDTAKLACCGIKRAQFKSEKEWRIVGVNYDGDTMSYEHHDDFVPGEEPDRFIEESTGIPCKHFLLPPEVLESVMLKASTPERLMEMRILMGKHLQECGYPANKLMLTSKYSRFKY